jgi:hypothetical protein
LCSRAGSAARIWLNGRHQRHAQAGQFAVDAEVVLPESAGPGNRNAQDGSASYFAAPGAGSLPSTVFRQRP